MVVGMGVTGQSVARFLDQRGARLTLTNRRTDITLPELPRATVHLGADDPAWLGDAELVVTSPGVPRDSQLLQAAVGAHPGDRRDRSPRISGALYRRHHGNQRHHTVTVTSARISSCGMKTFVGGNLGTPPLDAVGRDLDVVVAEVRASRPKGSDLQAARRDHPDLTHDHLWGSRSDDDGRAKARMSGLRTPAIGRFSIATTGASGGSPAS